MYRQDRFWRSTLLSLCLLTESTRRACRSGQVLAWQDRVRHRSDRVVGPGVETGAHPGLNQLFDAIYPKRPKAFLLPLLLFDVSSS